MKQNDYLCINNIIYQIYNIPDFHDMRITFLNILGNLIPNTCASILLADQTDSPNLLCDPICIPKAYETMESDYLSIEALDYSRWMLFSNKSVLTRDTDLFPDEERVKTEFYKKCFLPYNLHYGVTLSLADNNQLLGTLSLYRSREMGDFTDEELFMLHLLADHLNARFYRELFQGVYREESDLILQLIKGYGLTGREAEVLQLIFEELTNEEIAAKMCISPNTLKKHMQNLYRKFGASSRWEVMSHKLRQV